MLVRYLNKVLSAGYGVLIILSMISCATISQKSHDDKSFSKVSSPSLRDEVEYDWFELQKNSSQHPFLQSIHGKGNGLQISHQSCDQPMKLHRERSQVAKSSAEFGFSVSSSKEGFKEGVQPYLAHRCP